MHGLWLRDLLLRELLTELLKELPPEQRYQKNDFCDHGNLKMVDDLNELGDGGVLLA